MGFFLANCIGKGKKRRNSMGASTIPRFQIPQLPDDDVNGLVNRDKIACEWKKPAGQMMTFLESDQVKYWKPFHNAIVSNVPTTDSTDIQPNYPISTRNDEREECTAIIEKSTAEPLKDEDQTRKLVRTPTPDALLTFTDKGYFGFSLTEIDEMPDFASTSLVFPENLANTLPIEFGDSFQNLIPLHNPEEFVDENDSKAQEFILNSSDDIVMMEEASEYLFVEPPSDGLCSLLTQSTGFLTPNISTMGSHLSC